MQQSGQFGQFGYKTSQNCNFYLLNEVLSMITAFLVLQTAIDWHSVYIVEVLSLFFNRPYK